ncbi:MAG: class I SAM-dependent methyltransferase [Acidobacteria bacterium]|nr:class I SAM-dependent methyltransferase [Acidobacteriota bacterium]
MMQTAPVRTGWSRRVHAWFLAYCGGRYERMVADRKGALLGELHGDILEIGPGAGPNLAYYSPGCRWIGVEPNPYMYPYLRKAAERRGLQIEIRSGLAEKLPAEDDSIDAVVSTLVLCSVNDPAATLGEVLRVLRPGGRFLFIEHVAAPPGTRLRRVQEIIRPLWKRIADGCHPNRETWKTITNAGFDEVHYDHFRLPLGPVGPQIAGYAVK